MEVAVQRRHGEGCECRRCRGLRGAVDGVPFADGNLAAATHLAYVSEARLSEDERTRELEGEIFEAAPWITATDKVTVTLLAITLTRVERGVAAMKVVDDLNENPVAPYLAGKDAPGLATLRNDLRLWIRQAAQLASSLGLDPLSRSRLGVNVARIQESPVMRMQREARERELEAAS